MFTRDWYQLIVFPRLPLVTGFPALDTGYRFSGDWRLQVFPRLPLVTGFPSGYGFSRACRWLQDFPALGIGYIFSHAWHVTCFRRAWLR